MNRGGGRWSYLFGQASQGSVAAAGLPGAAALPWAVRRPPLSPFQAAHATLWARSLAPHATLWAMATHNATALTFRPPRTSSRTRPRFRAWALTHSIVLALWR